MTVREIGNGATWFKRLPVVVGESPVTARHDVTLSYSRRYGWTLTTEVTSPWGVRTITTVHIPEEEFYQLLELTVERRKDMLDE